MKKEILIFSKYFGYNVGGAERSMFELLRLKEKEGFAITVLIVENVKSFKAQKFKVSFPPTWKLKYIRLKYDYIRFTYLQYFLNKKNIVQIFQNLPEYYELWTYGYYAPIAINNYSGKSKYFVRDEFGLGWNRNYYTGFKYLAKKLYLTIENYWYKKWKRELLIALDSAKLVANSYFIANELKKISRSNSVEILHSNVNSQRLISEYNNLKSFGLRKGIVIIGDNILKGSEIIRPLSRMFPRTPFYIFDRKNTKIKQNKNIYYMPWQTTSTGAYAYAKLVLVPSKWAEAFPRVIIEAQILGIPVIASSNGGNPEAIINKSNLVINFGDIYEWKKKIECFI